MSSDPRSSDDSPFPGKAPPDALTAFFKYGSAYRYVLLCIFGYGLTPVLIDLVFPITPPWPDSFGVAAFTSIAIYLVLIFAYVSWLKIAQRDMRKLTRWFVGLAACGLVVYLILSVLFVHNAPNFRYREAGGYELRPEIDELLRAKPGLSIEDVFQSSEYKPTRVWTDISVRVVRATLLISWLAFFASLSVVIAAFVLHQQKAFAQKHAQPKKRTPPKPPTP